MKINRAITHAALLSLLTALGGLAITATGKGTSLEQSVGLEWLFALRGAVPAPSDVVMVTMDEAAAAEFSTSSKLRDWRRSHHAELVDKLTESGAAVIAFDLIFEQAREDDVQFAEALRRSGRVVLYQWADKADIGQLVGDTLVSPSDTLAEAVSGLGPFPLPEPSTGRTDRFWTFFDRVNNAPTLPVVALQMLALRHVGYSDFLRLLAVAGIAEPLPLQLESATELRRLMATLRRVFSSVPTYQRFLQAISAETGLSRRDRQLLGRLAEVYHGSAHEFFGYYGPPLTVTHIPYQAFWQSAASALPNLKGKTVIIGATERNERDKFYTVFTADNGQKLNGIEILATAFANLLHGHTLHYPSGALHMGLILGFGLLAGLIGALLKGLRSVAGIIVLGAAYLTGSQLLFNQYALWLPLFVPIALQLPLALLIGALSRNRWLERTGDNVKRLLGYHVPAWVVETSEDSAEPVSPTRVYGTCLVSDVAGYTSLAERVDPEQLAVLSNDYFDRLIDRIKHYEGEMMVIVGDGMTSVWPADQPDRATRLRACFAALDMLAAIAEFNREHQDHAFPTRIGLHAGWVAMGDLGGSGRFSFGLTGDIVNTASRIEGLSKYLGTELLATDIVVADLDELLLRRVGRFQLKGKGEALSVFQILGREANAGDDLRLLRDHFEVALAAFEAGLWSEAAQQFAAVFARFPADGPTRFYLDRCRRYAESPPQTGGEVSIRLDVK